MSTRPVPTREEIISMVGEDLAHHVDLKLLKNCVADAHDKDIDVTADNLAVARTLLYVVSGSALLDGDKKALKDAGTLCRIVCAANSLLIGQPLTPPRKRKGK